MNECGYTVAYADLRGTSIMVPVRRSKYMTRAFINTPQPVITPEYKRLEVVTYKSLRLAWDEEIKVLYLPDKLN